MERKVRSLRLYVLVLVAIILFFGILGPTLVASSNRRALENATLEITCKGFQNQIEQLNALEQIRTELGLPGALMTPEVPPECAGH